MKIRNAWVENWNSSTNKIKYRVAKKWDRKNKVHIQSE